MAESSQEPADRAPETSPDIRLDSWKEIAAYLKRDVTTVRRWEKRETLPVHRHLHHRRDSVFAYKREIDAWWDSRRYQLGENGAVDELPPGLANGNSSAPSIKQPWHLPDVRRTLWGAAAAVVFLAMLVTAWRGGARSQSATVGDRPELRFSLFPPEKTNFGEVSVSPDGRQIAFTAAGDHANGLLWIRPLDATTARSIPDTEGAMFPFWSPASDALGFFAGGKLWVFDLSGGRPLVLADAPTGRGGAWNRDGVIVFAPRRDGGLFRVAASGGPATPLTTVDTAHERGHLWPAFLPDEVHFLYLADSNTPEGHHLNVGALDGGPSRHVLQVASAALFTRDGSLMFVRDRHLLAQPFDPRTLALTGEAVVLVDSIELQADYDHRADFSVSDTGILAFRRKQSPAARLVWRDRAQARGALVATPARDHEPALSPDETRVAIDRFDPDLSKRFGYGVDGVRSDIVMVDRATGAVTPFTSDPAAEWGPVWSPDGNRLVFSSNRQGRLELYEKTVNDHQSRESLIASIGENPVAQSWSPDGRYLVYSAFDATTHMDLWLLPMFGDRTPAPLVRTTFNELQAQISPDGRWLAYVSAESGREEVYVQRFPTPAARSRVSTNGGADPRWRPDGKELFYIAEDRQLMAVEVDVGATFDYAPATALFDTGVAPHWYNARNLYDVSRDGRFLFMTPVEDDRSSPFTIVVHWTHMLAAPSATR